MHGYSKMAKIHIVNLSNRSKSLDFSDITASPELRHYQHPQHHRKLTGEDDDGKGLRRSNSSASQRFIPAAVKRALSMRKHGSVAESYRRIHDTGEEEEEEEEVIGEEYDEKIEMKKKISSRRKAGKFFRACKNFFGF